MKQLLLSLPFAVLLAACHSGKGNGTAADSVYRHISNSNSKGCDTFQSQHYTVPRRQGRVNDFESLLSEEDKATIDSLSRAYQQETGNQLAVVTVTPSMAPKPVFDCYATLIANTWGIGEKGKDNGIVIALSEEEAQIRICIGKGLESKITGAATKAIIDTAFIPSFTKDKYGPGIIKGVKVLMQAIR